MYYYPSNMGMAYTMPYPQQYATMAVPGQQVQPYYQQQSMYPVYQQQMVQQPMMHPMQVQQQPAMQPMQQVGYGGFNGGYFNGYYGGYNPYNIQQAAQARQEAYNRAVQNQRDLMTRFYNISCNGLGITPDPYTIDSLNGIDPQERIEQEFMATMTPIEQMNYRVKKEKERQQRDIDKMLETCVPYVDPRLITQINHVDKMLEKRKKDVPDDMGLAEYMSSGMFTKDLYAAEDNLRKKEESNLTKLFNEDVYRAMMRQFKDSGPFDKFNPKYINMEDLSVHMPSSVSEESRRERRLAFIHSLMDNS